MSKGSGVIAIDGLTRRFGKTVAVRPLALEIGPGGITGLLGPNGSGKSTLLRMLIGLVRPDAGTCSVDGVALAGDGTAIRRAVTYVPGETHVYGELSGRAHLDWLLRGREPRAHARAVELAEGFGLPLTRRVRKYSHGMKRQLFLAAALAPDVRVRILDEPTEGLDPTRRGEIVELLAKDAERTTILLSSHHLGEVDRACKRLLFLRKGELLDQAVAATLHERARRALRVQWGTSVERARLEHALGARARDTELRLDGTRATLFLPGDEDPRAALTALLASSELPEPVSFVYGELSLQELYRELYGQEGV